MQLWGLSSSEGAKLLKQQLKPIMQHPNQQQETLQLAQTAPKPPLAKLTQFLLCRFTSARDKYPHLLLPGMCPFHLVQACQLLAHKMHRSMRNHPTQCSVPSTVHLFLTYWQAQRTQSHRHACHSRLACRARLHPKLGLSCTWLRMTVIHRPSHSGTCLRLRCTLHLCSRPCHLSWASLAQDHLGTQGLFNHPCPSLPWSLGQW